MSAYEDLLNGTIRVTTERCKCQSEAHQQHRRAEAHIRCERFDEAIACHHNAARSLEDAKLLTTITKSLESLQLQQDFHNSQEAIIRLKKTQFDSYKKAVEEQRQKMIQGLVPPPTGQLSGGRDNTSNSGLQSAIYRTMEEADSLMEYLVARGTGSDADESDSQSVTVPTVEWSKRPKDDRTVIEELRTLNHQLRTLVVQLVTQLDAKSRESDELRQRVVQLESGPGSVCASERVTGSPFVFSPCSELSPEAADPHVSRVLPILAPLEMPDFDFSVFQRQPDPSDL